MSARVEGQPAFTLHSIPYRETSALVDFITPGHGRIRAVAKGVRNPRSRLQGALHCFRPLQINWQGRGELKTLTGVEVQESGPFYRGRSLFCGLYLNELLLRLLQPLDSQPRLFAYYQFAVGQLDDDQGVEPVLRVFERELLETLGFGFSSTHDAGDNSPIGADQEYCYQPDRGFIAVSDCPGSQNPASVFRGEQILAFSDDDFSAKETRRMAKRLMRLALEPHLGGRSLMSRELFRKPGGSGINGSRK
jgi:DNA repair protein RecO (recombination protein O)